MTRRFDRRADDDDDAGGEPGVALISLGALIHLGLASKAWMLRAAAKFRRRATTTDRPPPPRYPRVEPTFEDLDLYPAFPPTQPRDLDEEPYAPAAAPPAPRRTRAPARAAQPRFNTRYETPPLALLAEPKKSDGARSPTTRWSRTRGCSRACSTISASRARSSTCVPARSSRSTSWSRRRASSRRASSGSPTTSPARCRRSRPASPSCRAATPSASNCRTSAARRSICAKCSAREDFEQLQAQARHRARQDDRRRAGHRRSRQDAASAGRRHHRLRQVGRDQHHDPVAALPAEAEAVPAHHGRSEDAGALRLRRHPASAHARRHRSEEGGRRAQMGGARDGGPLPQDVEDRRAQHRRLQRPRRRGARPRARRSPARCRPASTARPARRSTSRRR